MSAITSSSPRSSIPFTPWAARPTAETCRSGNRMARPPRVTSMNSASPALPATSRRASPFRIPAPIRVLPARGLANSGSRVRFIRPMRVAKAR